MLSDLKYALRQLGKNPGFTAIIALILALGIGSNTAVFTAADALLLRGLPVSNPQELVLLGVDGIQHMAGRLEIFSYQHYQLLRDHSKSLSGIVAVQSATLTSSISGSDQSKGQSVRGDEVSGNYFSVLGVPVILGRPLTPDDDRTDAPRAVVVLSHAYWERRFGADPSVLGKTILLGNVSFSIIGVAPAVFFGVDPGVRADFWIPIQMMPLVDPSQSAQFRSPQGFLFRLVGRLQPGFTRETAAPELDLLFQSELISEGVFKSPAWENVKSFGKLDLQPGGSGYIPNRERIATLLTILMVVTGFVLVVACANVTGLLLARMVVQQRDLAVRQALGAGRGRIIRQLVTECLLLAVIGGALGLLSAHWGTTLLFNFLPGARTLDLSAGSRVVLFATSLSLAVAICIGLIPALRFSKLDLVSALKHQNQAVAGGASRRLNSTLVTGQIALSVCLLAGAGLFVHTLENLKNADLGFRRDNLLLVGVGLDKNANAANRINLFKSILTGLEASPGIRSATYSLGGLMSSSLTQLFTIDGYIPKANEQLGGQFSYVGPNYFQTLGIPLLRGRWFNEAELAGVPSTELSHPGMPEGPGVAVINATFARKYFGDSDPIGRIMHYYGGSQSARIIGVAGNAVYADLREVSSPEFYLPYFAPGAPAAPRSTVSFQVRTALDPLSLAPSIRAVIHGIDSKATVDLRTMDDLVDSKLSQESLIAKISSLFSLFALTLACLGLYGMLSYNVAQRTREIGVRMALGAHTGNIISLVLKQGVGLALIGCAIGVAAAIALSSFIAGSLYGVPSADPVTFLVVVVVLVLVALLACWLPARRATKVDPMTALRAE